MIRIKHIYTAVISFIVIDLLGFFAQIATHFEIPDSYIYVILFPFAEEIIKYISFKFARSSAIIFILMYAAFELILVKAPLLIGSELSEILYIIPLSLFAFIIHLVTISIYIALESKYNLSTLLFINFVYHAIYNSLPDSINDINLILILSFALSFTPFLLLYNRLRKI